VLPDGSCFFVNGLWGPKRAKTSRGAGCEPPARAPLRSNVEGLAPRGDRGEVCWAELFTMLKLDLRAVSAHGRDYLHALG
jgi:hypothetical protein